MLFRSTVANTYTQELLNLAAVDVFKPTLIGRVGTGANKYEAIGGWAVSTYYNDATSPFVQTPGSTVFDLAWYLSNNLLATPDWVVINLGINDCGAISFGEGIISIIDTAHTYLENMITNIHTVNANAKIGLCIAIPPCQTEDGAATGWSGLSIFQHKQKMLLWAKRLIAKFQGREVSNKIFLIPINVAIDTYYGFPYSIVNANSRSTDQIRRLIDPFHPSTSGYNQIADAIWAALKYNS